jgi:hypothetical protein
LTAFILCPSQNNSINKKNEELDSQLKKQIDLLPTIEDGHDAFMRALQNRLKNIQIVRSMWTNGNIKVSKRLILHFHLNRTMNEI